MTKRVFDLAIAAGALVVLSPVLALLALLVRVKLGHPVLFRQWRAGMDERPFQVLKFRSMSDERDEVGRLLPDARRLTSFGRWLRRSSLDELPELINVVKGDMSLVGPRPLPVEYLDHYRFPERRRHDVRPGLTGWAQVNGRNALDWDDRLAADVWYVDNRSWRLDARILALTVRDVITGRGVSAPTHATMAPLPTLESRLPQ